MMPIIVGRESLKYVVPADAEAYAQASTSPERMWEELTGRNGGLTSNIQRAHCELKNLIEFAAEVARMKRVSLAEIEIICPQLLSFEGWSNYTEDARDLHSSARQLRTWFVMFYGTNLLFHIDSAEESVSISFSPKTMPKHRFWWRFDY